MENSLMKIDIQDEVAVLVPMKDLDEVHSARFQELIREIVKKGLLFVVLDLQNVNYLASATLGMIAASIETLASRGGKLVLSNVNQEALRILNVVKLEEVTSIHTTTEKALEALNQLSKAG